MFGSFGTAGMARWKQVVDEWPRWQREVLADRPLVGGVRFNCKVSLQAQGRGGEAGMGSGGIGRAGGTVWILAGK